MRSCSPQAEAKPKQGQARPSKVKQGQTAVEKAGTAGPTVLKNTFTGMRRKSEHQKFGERPAPAVLGGIRPGGRGETCSFKLVKSTSALLQPLVRPVASAARSELEAAPVWKPKTAAVPTTSLLCDDLALPVWYQRLPLQNMTCISKPKATSPCTGLFMASTHRSRRNSAQSSGLRRSQTTAHRRHRRG